MPSINICSNIYNEDTTLFVRIHQFIRSETGEDDMLPRSEKRLVVSGVQGDVFKDKVQELNVIIKEKNKFC